jgi:hypothetical protein
MAPLPKKAPDLGNSYPVPRALMYVASLQTFVLQSHAIERPEDAMKARGLIGRNLG